MPRTVTVTIDDYTAMLLDELVASPGQSLREPTIECLASDLLFAWACGWRRPGSTERGLLRTLGHAEGAPDQYIPHYTPPGKIFPG